MSLKSKIEAVLYAAEEPVTLTQLVGLLGEEAQADLDAQATPFEQQESLTLEASAPSAPESSSSPEAAAQEADAAESSASSDSDKADAEKKAAKLRERALRDYFQTLVAALIADYASSDRGIEVREVAGGYRFSTKPEYHDAVRGFVKHLKPPLKLTLQALETLAVVAYKQPVTAPEISEIRGVDSAGVLGGLMTRKLIQTAGRKQVIGRPMLYKTTKDFLVRFGLKDVSELPSIEEFEKMAGELGELLEQDGPEQKEIYMPHDEDDESSTDSASPEGSASMDELHASEPSESEPSTLHESPEDMLDDKPAAPDGHKHEPLSTAAAAEAVEPSADVHEAQSDGTP